MTRSSLKLTSIAASLALLGLFSNTAISPNSALAADMLENGDYEVTEVEFGTGWYLRGDVGAGSSVIDLQASFVSDEVDLDSPVSIGLAAGRNFAEGLRIEGALNIYENTEFGASTLMGNFYADLGTYFGLRPYVGAGLGAAYVYWNDITFTDYCSGGGTSSCTLSSGESLTYAANAMLGVSYELSRGLNLDVGYRYTYFGEAGESAATDSFGVSDQLTVGSRSMHEIRMGLRYEIW